MLVKYAKDYIPLLQALADGKTLQYRPCREDIGTKSYPHGVWTDMPKCDLVNLNAPPDRFRVKPEPFVRYVGIYLGPSGHEYVGGYYHKTRAEAEDASNTAAANFLRIAKLVEEVE